ncbi:MAG: amino acid racemase [Pseudomonadota bacterium]
MKLLGLIGGVSPEATAIYYRLLNQAVRERRGGEHSANLLLYALDYGVMIEHYNARDWEAFKAEVAIGARRLSAAGAEALMILSNTTHVAADAARDASGLPLIHMLDVLAAGMDETGARRPLLLGTPVVMGEEHYRSELAKRYDGEVIAPTLQEQETVGRIILDELVNGAVRDESRDALLSVIGAHECDGVILGCTELCMILDQSHTDVPVFDTTGMHAKAGAAYALGDA